MSCIKKRTEVREIEQPVRILHTMVRLGRGGAETLMMSVLRKLDRKRVIFDFLTSAPDAYDDEVRALGGRVYYTPFITESGPFKYAANLREFFAEHPEYKIVHSHMDKFSGLVMREAKKAGVPVRIAHCHSAGSEGGLIYRAVKGYYGSKVNANATDLFACSDAAASWMFGERADEAIIVKNGIDISRFKFSPRAHDGLTLAHVGRFVKAKKQSFLLDVFARLLQTRPDSRLLLVGDGPLRQEGAQKAARLGIAGSVEFLGERDDIADILNGADAFCLPSLFEGLGIVLIEAQCCGLPCVAGAAVPRDANVTGRVRFLPLGDAEAWARALLESAQTPKADGAAAIRAAGYDISESAAFLQDFYLRRAREIQQ